jgi:hypothetical protein
MASPGKKPRLEAAASAAKIPATPKAVIILNKGKPTSRLIVSRPKQLVPKDGESSGTSANKEIGPIILVSKLSAVNKNLIHQSVQLEFQVTRVRNSNFSRRGKCPAGSDLLRFASTPKGVSYGD